MRATGIRKTAFVLGILAIATVGAWAGLNPAPPAPEGPTRFGAAMPRGALAYAEARDLSGALKAWIASPTRDRYYKSASYRSFTRSKLFYKLQDRIKELEQGFGLAFTEERLASLAGGPSAVALYDPAKLEMVFVTEAPTGQAAVAAVLAQASSFTERKTPKGSRFYSREITTDAGNLTQQIAFAHANGRLWLSTSDVLLAEAVDGPADGGLGAAIGETAKGAADFSSHDVTIWLDQEKVARNKYFGLYWIHRNGRDLSSIASALIDVEIARDGIHERRWFVMRDAQQATASGDAAALARLEAMAPQDAQRVEAKVVDADLSPAIAETLFGQERRGAALASVSLSTDSDLKESSDSSSSSSGTPASGRYRYLDDRFERDVDDSAATVTGATPVASRTPAGPKFADRLAGVLGAANPVRYATFGAIDTPDGALFARFRGGAILELGAPDKFDAAAFERLVAEEFGRRFVVGAAGGGAAWADVGGARTMAGALIAQGGAYKLTGNYLVLARDAAECSTVAARAGSTSAGAQPDLRGTVSRTAEVRLAPFRAPFAKLTSVLDSGASGDINEEISDSSEEEANNRPVLFFSQNLVSLLDVVKDLARVRVVTTREGSIVRERVDYSWS